MLCEALMPEPELLEGVPRRPRQPHQVPDGRAGDAVRRQGARVPAASSTSRGTRTTSRPSDLDKLKAFLAANADARSRRDGEGALIEQTLGVDSRGAARPVAAAVAQRLREGNAPARSRAGRRPQPRPDRRRAEPAGLPGRRGRPPHPLRQRGAALRARGDARIRRADRARIRPDQDLHVRRRRDRDARPRLGHRRRRGGRRPICAARARRSA